MSLTLFNTYDDMPVWVADSDWPFGAVQASLPPGLSIAVVLGDTFPSSLVELAESLVQLSPTLVHAFGAPSELVHDAIDAAMRKFGVESLTYWTESYTPAEVIFEFFTTDLPPERDLARWSGRLVLLAQGLPAETQREILRRLRDVDRAIQEALEADADCQA